MANGFRLIPPKPSAEIVPCDLYCTSCVSRCAAAHVQRAAAHIFDSALQRKLRATAEYRAAATAYDM